MASCSSCGAPILWVQLPSGKRMPVDAQPLQVVVVTQDGVDLRGTVRKAHSSHFATCPNASEHRRKS